MFVYDAIGENGVENVRVDFSDHLDKFARMRIWNFLRPYPQELESVAYQCPIAGTIHKWTVTARKPATLGLWRRAASGSDVHRHLAREIGVGINAFADEDIPFDEGDEIGFWSGDKQWSASTDDFVVTFEIDQDAIFVRTEKEKSQRKRC